MHDLRKYKQNLANAYGFARQQCRLLKIVGNFIFNIRDKWYMPLKAVIVPCRLFKAGIATC